MESENEGVLIYPVSTPLWMLNRFSEKPSREGEPCLKKSG